MTGKPKLIAKLICLTAVAAPASAYAQTAPPAADAPVDQAQALARAQARIEQLEGEVQTLKGQVAQIKASMASETPPAKPNPLW